MSALAGTLGDLTRYDRQRSLPEPLLVLVGGDVNYHGEQLAPVTTVKRRDGRQVSSQRALAVLQIGQSRAILDLERSSVNYSLSAKRRFFFFFFRCNRREHETVRTNSKLLVRYRIPLITLINCRKYLFVLDQGGDSSRLQHKKGIEPLLHSFYSIN